MAVPEKHTYSHSPHLHTTLHFACLPFLHSDATSLGGRSLSRAEKHAETLSWPAGAPGTTGMTVAGLRELVLNAVQARLTHGGLDPTVGGVYGLGGSGLSGRSLATSSIGEEGEEGEEGKRGMRKTGRVKIVTGRCKRKGGGWEIIILYSL